MKIQVFFISALLLLGLTAAAQTKYKTIYQDTIHLCGVVYDAQGKPVYRADVVSQNIAPQGTGFLTAMTDSLGRFELIGARPKDTLWISGITSMRLINTGSRFLVITLPPLKETIINQTPAVTISARSGAIRKKAVVKIPIEDGTTIIDAWEHMAGYPGGQRNFSKYLQSAVRYPEKASKAGIGGTVEVSFIVQKDGTLANFKVTRGLGYGCDEEVIRVLKASKKWKPALINSQPWDVPQSVSVEFRLTDK